jgi:quercetin dioxygenase-like cupin family protein
MSEASALIARGPGEGKAVPSSIANNVIFKLTGAETGGAQSMFETSPGPGAGPPLHVHGYEDEIIYIVEGTLRFYCGDKGEETREISAGGVAFMPHGIVHTWKNIGTEPARLIAIFTPASPGMEQFFQAFAEVPMDAKADSVEQEFARIGKAEANMDMVTPESSS